MRSLRLVSFVSSSALALALLLGGSARADVAPGPDAGAKTDMATTMAQPDMSAATTDDGGCSLAQHGQPGGLALVFAAGALALVVSRRRRTV